LAIVAALTQERPMSIRKLRVHLLRLCFAPVVLIAVFVRPSWPVGSGVAFAVELAGYLFLLTGLGIRIWSILYVGGHKSHILVTEGPYSICRNPLYVGTLLLAIGAGLCFENLLMLIVTVAIVLLAHVAATLLEERHLEEKFPEEYPAYKRRVPRFWPRLGNYRSRGTVEVSVSAIGRVMIDTVAILLLPEVEDILEVLHQHGILPVLWRFP